MYHYDLDKAFRVDTPKAIELIVYIASRAPVSDLYHVCKILYFADKHHLENYGSLICGDKYIAMKDGPVPSAVYDLLKNVRDMREKFPYYADCKTAFSVADAKGEHRVTALREPRLNMLSESELKCIDLSIQENGNLGFGELKDKSHDAAYDKAGLDNSIPLAAVIDTLPSAQDIKHHIQESLLG